MASQRDILLQRVWGKAGDWGCSLGAQVSKGRKSDEWSAGRILELDREAEGDQGKGVVTQESAGIETHTSTWAVASPGALGLRQAGR